MTLSTTPAGLNRLDLAETVRKARAIPAATLHEAAGKIGALPCGIRSITPGLSLAGTAFTVQSPGGDNLWLHRALYAAQPGDVLVVTVQGQHDFGYWGEVMSTAAKGRGLAGLVIDGCVRDGALLESVGIPVHARGLCIRGTRKDPQAPGWLDVPILVGDVRIKPGDLVVGDADGVVVIPATAASKAVQAAIEREAGEADILERLAAGERTLDIYSLQEAIPQVGRSRP